MKNYAEEKISFLAHILSKIESLYSPPILNVCTYACIYVYMYVCTYACMYVDR